MVRLDQESEAEIFSSNNAEKLSLVSDKLLQAAPVIISRCTEFAKADTELAGVLEKAREALSLMDVRWLFSVLRRNASKFTQIPNLSPVYWEWIDACGSLADARGTRWPYLTQEGRARDLIWAEEGVDKVLALAQ